MRILVTGGAGFIGSHIVDRLIAEDHAVTVVDNLVTGKKENLNPGARFYEADICDREKLDRIFEKEKPDIVDHHAAQMDVRKSVADPVYDARVNVIGTLNLLENSRNYGVKKFIFASSGGVMYGEPQTLPASEEDPPAPLSPYGVTKRCGELYLEYYSATHGLKFTALRYGNVYGPRQDPHGEAGVVAIFSRKMLEGATPTIFGDGEQLRDYVFVDDVVEANILALNQDESQIYNIGTGAGASVNTLYANLAKIMDFTEKPVYSDKRTGEIEKIYLNWQRAKKLLGWQAKMDFEGGLKKTVEYFKARKL